MSGIHSEFEEYAYISGFCLQILPILLKFAESNYILRDWLKVAESRTTFFFDCCRIREKTNVPTKSRYMYLYAESTELF